MAVHNDKWTAEKDYKAYPKEKWCDCDYVANWIKETNYNPKTSMENLVEMILAHYNGHLTDEDINFFDEDIKESENGLMISVEDVATFVEASGGLNEFDYYC